MLHMFVLIAIALLAATAPAGAEPTMRTVTVPCASTIEEFASLVTEAVDIPVTIPVNSDEWTEGVFFNVNDVPFEDYSSVHVLSAGPYNIVARAYPGQICLLSAVREAIPEERVMPPAVKQELERQSGDDV